MAEGQPRQLFTNQAEAGESKPIPVGRDGFTAIWVRIEVLGTTPSALITVEGSEQEGGQYRVLDVPQARQTNVTAARVFAVPVSTNWVRLRLASITGTFGKGLGYTASVTPSLWAPDGHTLRDTGVLLQNAAAAANTVGVPGSMTLSSANLTGGALAGGTSYNVGVAAVRFQPGSAAILGVTTITNVKAQATTAGHNAIGIADLNVTDADAYLVFCSTDAAPKLAAYVPATYLNTHDVEVNGWIATAFGTIAALDPSEPKRFHIGVVGTGLATNHAIFAQNTAHLLDSLTTLDCRGRTKVLLTVRAKLSTSTVWSAAPSLTLLPWFKSQESSADWARGTAITPTYLASAGDSLTTYHSVDVDGAAIFAVSVAAIAGLASVDVWAEAK